MSRTMVILIFSGIFCGSANPKCGEGGFTDAISLVGESAASCYDLTKGHIEINSINNLYFDRISTYHFRPKITGMFNVCYRPPVVGAKSVFIRPPMSGVGTPLLSVSPTTLTVNVPASEPAPIHIPLNLTLSGYNLNPGDKVALFNHTTDFPDWFCAANGPNASVVVTQGLMVELESPVLKPPSARAPGITTLSFCWLQGKSNVWVWPKATVTVTVQLLPPTPTPTPVPPSPTPKPSPPATPTPTPKPSQSVTPLPPSPSMNPSGTSTPTPKTSNKTPNKRFLFIGLGAAGGGVLLLVIGYLLFKSKSSPARLSTSYARMD